jgi:hypothetical protein
MSNSHLNQLLEIAKLESINYLEGCDKLPVFPSDDALKLLQQFNEKLPTAPNNPLETLKKLADIGSQTTVKHGGSRYFGFVNGGILPIGIAARFQQS